MSSVALSNLFCYFDFCWFFSERLTFVRFSIFNMSLSASPRRTRLLSHATSTSSSSIGWQLTGTLLYQEVVHTLIYSSLHPSLERSLSNPRLATVTRTCLPGFTHGGLRRKLYWHSMVMRKPTKPSIVMATSPRVTMSHSNGDFILSNWPGDGRSEGFYQASNEMQNETRIRPEAIIPTCSSVSRDKPLMFVLKLTLWINRNITGNVRIENTNW